MIKELKNETLNLVNHNVNFPTLYKHVISHLDNPEAVKMFLDVMNKTKNHILNHIFITLNTDEIPFLADNRLDIIVMEAVRNDTTIDDDTIELINRSGTINEFKVSSMSISLEIFEGMSRKTFITKLKNLGIRFKDTGTNNDYVYHPMKAYMFGKNDYTTLKEMIQNKDLYKNIYNLNFLSSDLFTMYKQIEMLETQKFNDNYYKAGSFQERFWNYILKRLSEQHNESFLIDLYSVYYYGSNSSLSSTVLGRYHLAWKDLKSFDAFVIFFITLRDIFNNNQVNFASFEFYMSEVLENSSDLQNIRRVLFEMNSNNLTIRK